MKKNVVIDYMTTGDTCKALGLKKSSESQITRWANEGRIPNVFKFGRGWAIPTSWVQSECHSRGIFFNGVELKEGENGVSLLDYESLAEYSKRLSIPYEKIHSRINRGTFYGDYIRFDRSYGVRKEVKNE